MPPDYNPVLNDDIELLTPGDRPEHQRHMRTGSNSSFVHFRAPQREEELKVTNGNHLATQVKKNFCVLFFYSQHLFSWQKI
jgi:solute carrier family 41